MASISIGTLYGYASGSNYGRYSCSLEYDSVTRSGTTVTMNNARVVMTRYSTGYTTNRIAIKAGYNGSETNLKNNATINSSGTASAASYNISLGSPSLTTVGTSFSFYVALASTGGSSSWGNFQGNSPISINPTISCPAAYPEFTSNPTATTVSETQISITCGSTNISSNMYYKVDDSGWVYMNTSPLTVSGLSAGQKHTFVIQARNASDNSLTTDSVAVSATTYAMPSIAAWPGNVLLDAATKSITVSFNNSRSRPITVTATSGSYSVTGSTSGSSVSLSLDSASLYSVMGATGTSADILLSVSGGWIKADKTISANAAASYAKPDVKVSGFVWSAKHASDIKKCFTNTNKMVQNKSALMVNMSSLANIMTAKYSATARSASIIFGEKTEQVLKTSSEAYISESTYFNYASSSLATIIVEDSRGYKNSATVSIPFVEYSLPIASISGARNDGYGSTVTLNFWGSCSSLDSTNSIVKYSWMAEGDSAWTDTVTSSAVVALDSSLSKTYYLKVTDSTGNVSLVDSEVITPGTPIFMLESSKQGVGVNCYPSGKGLYISGTRVPIITSGTGEPSGGENGDIYIKYS